MFGFSESDPAEAGLAADLKRVPGVRLPALHQRFAVTAKPHDRLCLGCGLQHVIMLRLYFQSSYPASPPYVRVIRPRFQFRTGHITIGTSCVWTTSGLT